MTDINLMNPPADCNLCLRLVHFRFQNQKSYPGWHNGPVPVFGVSGARLIIVGLAPGLKGANRTGRPFTGDHAGVMLYQTLITTGFAQGHYDPEGQDDLRLNDTMIVNAVRCVPPGNMPQRQEERNCAQFLRGILPISGFGVVVALGGVAHRAVIGLHGLRQNANPFEHGRMHRLNQSSGILIDSYHCSRRNTNTGLLTAPMFGKIFETARDWMTQYGP